jgi:hypothetical protein
MRDQMTSNREAELPAIPRIASGDWLGVTVELVNNLGIFGVAVIGLASLMLADEILQKIALHLRIRQIRSKDFGHSGKLVSKPQQMLAFCIYHPCPLIALCSLIKLGLQSHIKRTLSYLQKILANVGIKQKLRVGSPGVKRK